MLPGRGGNVARHGSGDVRVPRAEPLRRRLIGDAPSDLLGQGFARMGPHPVGRLCVRVREQPARRRALASAWQRSRDGAGRPMAKYAGPARPVAAGVDDEPLGHSEIPIQLGRVTDLPAGRIVVGHIQREPVCLSDIRGPEASRHLSSRHPVRVARIEVDPVALRLQGLDRVREHLQPGLPLCAAPAAIQFSERVRLQDHHCGPAAEAGREPVDPLLVRMLLGFQPAVRRVEDQVPQPGKHDKDARPDDGDHSSASPPKPSHGPEYSRVCRSLSRRILRPSGRRSQPWTVIRR